MKDGFSIYLSGRPSGKGIFYARFFDSTGKVIKTVSTKQTSKAAAERVARGLAIKGVLPNRDNWIHSASTSRVTHYHDGWKAYLRFDCGHGLCNAHPGCIAFAFCAKTLSRKGACSNRRLRPAICGNSGQPKTG